MESLIRMTKKDLLSTIANQLSDSAGFRFVISPISLFVADNPDVIVTYSNKLYGIYIPSKYELEHLDSLRRRLYLSRLAYASDMRVILVINEMTAQEKPFLKYESHRILLENEIDQLCWLMEGNGVEIKTKLLSKNIRRQAANTYYLYMELQERLRSEGLYGERIKYDILKHDEWEKMSYNGKIFKDAYQTQDTIIYNKKSSSGSVRKRLDHILTCAMFKQYDTKECKLYLNNANHSFALLNTDIFQQNTDSILVSSLAYLGILPVCIDYDQFERIHDIGMSFIDKVYGNKKR